MINEKITERQVEYIEALIRGFDITTVTKRTVSEIIECLEKFQDSYAPCGKHRNVDIGEAFVMGDWFWCHNHCDPCECVWYNRKE